MRLWHLLFAVFLASMALAIARDPIGRVALVVFFTTIGLVILGLSSIMMLFRAVGAIGMARNAVEEAGALLAAAGVALFGGGAMLLILYCGFSVLAQVVP